VSNANRLGRVANVLAVSTDRAYAFDAKDTDEDTRAGRPAPRRTVRRACQPRPMTDNNPPTPTGPLAPLFLPGIAGTIVTELRANGFDPLGVLCIAEEAGEVVGAYRRYAGLARRTGTLADVGAELADVVITSYVSAHAVLFDLDAAIGETVLVAENWHPKLLVQALFIQAARFVEVYPHTASRFALAAVVVAARSVATAMDIDLDAAIREKLAVVFSRGWREGGDQS
jgi:NTP pyrophosphatase (non-canonical NTP hydrolase)